MKILLVDDHSIVRAGLRGLLATWPGVEILEAGAGRDALAQMRAARPDLTLLDLNLPGVGGLELLRRMLADNPEARILILSMHSEPFYATRAMEAGARGYVSKNAPPEELLRAIRKIADGGRYVERDIAQELALQGASPADPIQRLNERDLEILRLLADGRSMTEIAAALGLGYKTIANTCTQIKTKLGVARTADMIRLSLEMGLASRASAPVEPDSTD